MTLNLYNVVFISVLCQKSLTPKYFTKKTFTESSCHSLFHLLRGGYPIEKRNQRSVFFDQCSPSSPRLEIKHQFILCPIGADSICGLEILNLILSSSTLDHPRVTCKPNLEHVNEVHSLCSVLGLDFGQTVSDVHPSLHETHLEQSTNISDSRLDGLQQTIRKLKTDRKARIQKLKDTLAMLFDLWKLMDSPKEEKNDYMRIASILRSSESAITERGVLSTEIMEQASAEVERLAKMKASRMKELVLKRRSELEELCKMIHIEADASTAADKSTALIGSGFVDPSELLSNIEAQILKVKDEAASRKEIMDRIDKWLSACEEENWLEQWVERRKSFEEQRVKRENIHVKTSTYLSFVQS